MTMSMALFVRVQVCSTWCLKLCSAISKLMVRKTRRVRQNANGNNSAFWTKTETPPEAADGWKHSENRRRRTRRGRWGCRGWRLISNIILYADPQGPVLVVCERK